MLRLYKVTEAWRRPFRSVPSTPPSNSVWRSGRMPGSPARTGTNVPKRPPIVAVALFTYLLPKTGGLPVCPSATRSFNSLAELLPRSVSR